MKIKFTGDWMPRKDSEIRSRDATLWVGNLECAFASNCGEVKSAKAYSSVLPQDAVELVGKSQFSALSVANNHTYDAGGEAFDKVLKRLHNVKGLQIFGTTDCPYAFFSNDVESKDSRSSSVIVIACLEPCRSRGARIFKEEDVLDLIVKLKSGRERESTIVVYPHWGKEGEFTRYPSPRQRRLARSWLDAGADGVIGNHSHIPQGMEWYKGKPIYYCLGNYDFPIGETNEYPESFERMTVSFESGSWQTEHDSDASRERYANACGILDDRWTLWTWARHVGPVYISKNMSSWGIRLRKKTGFKSKMVTIAKFLVWNVLPQTMLFRMANVVGKGK